MSIAATALEEFKRAEREFSLASKALHKLRNEIPPDGMRSLEEELLWKQIKHEYQIAAKAYWNAKRVFTSTVKKASEGILSNTGISLKQAVKTAEHEKNIEVIKTDPALAAIMKAAQENIEKGVPAIQDTPTEEMDVPFEN